MQKNKTTDQERKQKPRRLSLNRETILTLNDPVLLGLARGGTLGTSSQSFGGGGGATCEPPPSRDCY